VRRALERKGVLAEHGRDAQPQELLRALLGSGVTTSRTLTEVSGRGIGLDVVRDAARSLGGHATMTTHAGAGTTVELEVPVTLSSLNALLVEAGTTIAAIPLSAVRQTLRVPQGDALGSGSIAYDGHLIPFVALPQALGAAPRGVSTQGAGARSAVIVSGGDGIAAIAVDRLLGTADILVRPLPALAAADPVVASVSLDAQGNPRLVLDPAGLVAVARQATHQPSASAPPAAPILIVDDSLTTRMLEQSILESAGYEVELATSGEEALQKAQHRTYALFLVDVEMPGMDGFAVLARMQATPELRNIPAILVTSRNAPEDRQRGVEVGARDYMVKSEFDQVALLHRIRGLIG
jgi:two-component system, chemotaxis family, sensor kinase CheA